MKQWQRWPWLAILGLSLAPAALAQPPPVAPDEAYTRLIHGLRPRITVEVLEADVNEYLRSHPGEFPLPEDLEDPLVALGGGVVVVSARARVLFITSRVSVSLEPVISQGRLRLPVRQIRASGIRLPNWFHKGVADNLTDTLNGFLDRNDLYLLGVEIEAGKIRATAQMNPRSVPTLRR